MQSIIRRGLKKAGYDQLEIKLANDGVEALDIIKVWEPDMVLSDWHMPNMTGMELLLAIKQQMLNVPIGLVTTETSDVRIREALEAGALFVINKPFEDAQLLETVLAALQNQAPRQRPAEPAATAISTADLQMPTSNLFADCVNKFAQHEVLVESIEPISLQDKLMPCVLGLYEDDSKKSRAVVILDLRAAAILGGAVVGATPQDVRQAIAQQQVAKNLLEGCKAVLKATGDVVSDSATRRALYLRSVNLIPEVFPKLQSIYARTEIARSDFEIAVAGYGQGLVTLIAT
jgi:CheY-like chemotaxis protein